MNALPMLERCFTQQWRALEPCEQDSLARAWAAAQLGSATALHGAAVSQHETPIWSVCSWGGVSLTLISVKHEYLEDVVLA